MVRKFTSVDTVHVRAYRCMRSTCFSGVHHKKKNCQASEVVKKVEDILSQAKNFLFPKVMSTFQGQTKKSKVPKGNGGWGDLRDRKLCLNMAQLPAKDDDQVSTLKAPDVDQDFCYKNDFRPSWRPRW